MAFRYSGKGWRVAHSLKTFGDQIMDLRGHKTSYTVDGTLGNLEHSNRTSDHNPDANGIVRALDFFEHKPGFVDEIAEYLRASKDPRLKYFIHDDRMFASYSNSKGKAWQWRDYNGINGHETHGHLSVVASDIADQDHEWELNVMTPAQEAKLDAVLNLLAGLPKAAADQVLGREWVEEGIGPDGKVTVLQATVKGYKNTVGIRAAVADLQAMETVELQSIATAVADELHKRTAD